MPFFGYLIVQVIVAVVWCLLASRFRRKQQAACEAVLILLLPVAGLLILLFWRVACLIAHCDANRPEYHKDEREEFSPGMEYQADIVPLSDTYLLGDARMKRRLFTDAIKQEVVENPTILQDAVHDEDREITYYAVSMMTAHMEKVTEEIEAVKKQLDAQAKGVPVSEDTNSTVTASNGTSNKESRDALLDRYAGLLETYLEHGYGDAPSRSLMEHELRATLTQLVQHSKETATSYERQIRAFLRGKEYEEAEAACKRYDEACPGEEGPVYMRLVLAAARHDAAGMRAAIAELRALPVRLSPRALKAIRYWGGDAA